MNKISIQELDIEKMERSSRAFFQRFGTCKLLGKQFFKDLEKAKGKDLFDKLLSGCGFENNVKGFFHKLVFLVEEEIEKEIVVKGIKIPVLFLYDFLETVIPGNSNYSLKTVDELEKRAFVRVDDQAGMQEVMDRFPVRLSDHVIRQSLVSFGVAKQYLPFIEELDLSGHTITFDGHFKKGVLEQMYKNRVIFLLDMRCPVYCRFCFRKHKSTRKEKCPAPEDVMLAAEHVKAHSSIKEILITGGEPLLNKRNLETAIDALMEIDHVRVLRIATRTIAYFPELLLKNDSSYIRYLLKKNAQCLEKGKRIEIGVHFVHPDEISIQSLDIISQFVKNGIKVYVQTPFLNKVNTRGKDLGRLFALLRQAGAKIYYIFTPCSPIHGTKEYWTTISQAFEAVKYLRENFSDRCIPKLCTATPLGKIEWNTSGWAVEKDKADENYTWIRTPYTREYFKDFITDKGEMPDFRENNEGTLDARFRITMGEDALLTGNRSLIKSPGKKSAFETEETLLLPEEIDLVRSLFPSIEETPSKKISRVHKTCLEMHVDADKQAWEYLQGNSDITDVILFGDTLLSSMENTCRIIKRVKSFSHVVCIRLCPGEFNTHPDRLTSERIQALSELCDFSLGNPFRIEIETWFLLPEVLELHGKIAEKLAGRGINIYANVPLIKGVNDSPKTIVSLAHQLRKSGIEFHHLYVEGLRIQEKYNPGKPVEKQRVIDIASEVRKECSGREIPLYIIQTKSGEIEFDLNR